MITFSIPIKGFSVNAYYYGNRRIKTKEARLWEAEFISAVSPQIKKQLTDMQEEFNLHGGVFSLSLEFLYPRATFYNLKTEVSARTLDLTNVEKPVQDLLFNQLMGVDDRFVTRLKSVKKASSKYEIKIRIVYSKTQLVSGLLLPPPISLP